MHIQHSNPSSLTPITSSSASPAFAGRISSKLSGDTSPILYDRAQELLDLMENNTELNARLKALPKMWHIKIAPLGEKSFEFLLFKNTSLLRGKPVKLTFCFDGIKTTSERYPVTHYTECSRPKPYTVYETKEKKVLDESGKPVWEKSAYEVLDKVLTAAEKVLEDDKNAKKTLSLNDRII